MEDEKKLENGEGAGAPNNEQDYIDAIKNLKDSTVSKEDYQKLLDENKKLIKSLTNGETLSIPKPEEVNKSIEEMRKKLCDASGQTNLQYIQNVLKLREAVMERGDKDPFLPQNEEYVENEADALLAQQIADSLQEAVDYAGNDGSLFCSELKRRANRK